MTPQADSGAVLERTTSTAGVPTPTFAQALRFWFVLGWISFGGPAGQIAILHAELVDKRRWIDEVAFLRALNFCMLLPGPEAMQLATWLGWRLHGMRGGIAAGALFVLPAAVLLGLLSWAYLALGQLPWVAGVVFGLQAAVLGILVQALQRIGARVLRTRLALALAGGALLALAAGVPFPLIVLVAGAIGVLAWRRRPHWLPVPVAAHAGGTAPAAPREPQPLEPLPPGQPWRSLRVALASLALWWLPVLALWLWLGPDSTSVAMGLFFSRAALVTVGGAYAVLPYVAQQAVEVHAWLTPAQMLAGLGLAETTPGPLILVLEFVGFVGGWQHPDLASPLASAVLGAAVTVWTTFLPSFAFVLTAAPWIEPIARWRWVSALLAGVTAAVAGVIVHLALWFGWRLLSVQAWPTVVLGVAIAGAVYLGLARARWPVALLVPLAGAAGALAQAWLPVAGG